MTRLNIRGILSLVATIGFGIAAVVFPIGLSKGYGLFDVIIESLKWGLITAAVSFAALYVCSILEKRSKWLATIVSFIMIGLMILAVFILLQMQSSAE
jgi:hypothetical protein